MDPVQPIVPKDFTSGPPPRPPPGFEDLADRDPLPEEPASIAENSSDESNEHDSDGESDNDDGWTLVQHRKPKPKPEEKKRRQQQRRQQGRFGENSQGPVSASYDQIKSYPTFGGSGYSKEVVFRRKKAPQKVVKTRAAVPNDNARRLNKIENENDVYQAPKVRPELSARIQTYRRENNLTQAELAQKLNLKLDVINSYEKGTALHDPATTSKIKQFLNRPLPKSQA